MSKPERAGRGVQRERIWAHRDAIVDAVETGQRYETIRTNLGLGDIPLSTFKTHAKRIAEAGPTTARRVSLVAPPLARNASVEDGSDERAVTAEGSGAGRKPGRGSVKAISGTRFGKVGGRESGTGLDPAKWREAHGDDY